MLESLTDSMLLLVGALFGATLALPTGMWLQRRHDREMREEVHRDIQQLEMRARSKSSGDLAAEVGSARSAAGLTPGRDGRYIERARSQPEIPRATYRMAMPQRGARGWQ